MPQNGVQNEVGTAAIWELGTRGSRDPEVRGQAPIVAAVPGCGRQEEAEPLPDHRGSGHSGGQPVLTCGLSLPHRAHKCASETTPSWEEDCTLRNEGWGHTSQPATRTSRNDR